MCFFLARDSGARSERASERGRKFSLTPFERKVQAGWDDGGTPRVSHHGPAEGERAEGLRQALQADPGCAALGRAALFPRLAGEVSK